MLRRKAAECPTDEDVLMAAHVLLLAALRAPASGGAGAAAAPAPPAAAPELRLNYDVYCTAREQLPGTVARYLTATTFLKVRCAFCVRACLPHTRFAARLRRACSVYVRARVLVHCTNSAAPHQPEP
jgi:hypothetical protein